MKLNHIPRLTGGRLSFVRNQKNIKPGKSVKQVPGSKYCLINSSKCIDNYVTIPGKSNSNTSRAVFSGELSLNIQFS
jgi:hypothetical protein